MTEAPVIMTDLEKSNLNWMADHKRNYLESGGAKGHIVDMSHLGGYAHSVTLLLKTIGRQTGEPRILPLLYSYIGGEIVLVASRGGSDVHPAWYFNMTTAETADFQIATQAFRASWRELSGEERETAWKISVRNYPPIADYTANTTRLFPIVALRARDAIDVF